MESRKQRKKHGGYITIMIVFQKEKLAALRLIIESDEVRFKLLSECPSVLGCKSLEERLSKIERNQVCEPAMFPSKTLS